MNPSFVSYVQNFAGFSPEEQSRIRAAQTDEAVWALLEASPDLRSKLTAALEASTLPAGIIPTDATAWLARLHAISPTQPPALVPRVLGSAPASSVPASDSTSSPGALRDAYFEKIRSLPGYQKLSPALQQVVDRIAARLIVLADYLYQVRSGSISKPDRRKLTGINNVDPRFREDKDYLIWIIQDSLEATLDLADWGEVPLVEMKIKNLAEATQYFLSLGPIALTEFNRLSVAQLFKEPVEHTQNLVQAGLTSLQKLNQGRIKLDQTELMFSVSEQLAFEMVKEKVRQFASRLEGVSANQVKQALLGVGVDPMKIRINMVYDGRIPGMAWMPPDLPNIRGVSDNEKGYFLLTGKLVDRNFVLGTYARYVAEQEGLMMTSGPLLSPVDLSYASVKSALFGIELSRFLFDEAEALGLQEALAAFEGRLVLKNTQALQTQLNQAGIRRSLNHVWPKALTGWTLPLEDLQTIPADRSGTLSGDDYSLLGNGSQSFRDPDRFLTVLPKIHARPFNGRILSLGAGVGSELFLLAQLNGPKSSQTITAVDSSVYVARNLRRLIDRGFLPHSLQVQSASMEDAVLLPASFDHIVSINSFDFVDPARRAGVLEKIANSLGKGGRATIAVLHPKSFNRTDLQSYGITVEHIDSNRYRIKQPGPLGVSYIKSYLDIEDMRALAQAAGLISNTDYNISLRQEQLGTSRAVVQVYTVLQIDRKEISPTPSPSSQNSGSSSDTTAGGDLRQALMERALVGGLSQTVVYLERLNDPNLWQQFLDQAGGPEAGVDALFDCVVQLSQTSDDAVSSQTGAQDSGEKDIIVAAVTLQQGGSVLCGA